MNEDTGSTPASDSPAERLAEAKARYERMCVLVETDPGAGSHACALSYSIDVPWLISEVERLRAENRELRNSLSALHEALAEASERYL